MGVLVCVLVRVGRACTKVKQRTKGGALKLPAMAFMADEQGSTAASVPVRIRAGEERGKKQGLTERCSEELCLLGWKEDDEEEEDDGDLGVPLWRT